MDTTANLKMPFILPSQAQKHVTHNEALKVLDAAVQLAVADRDLSAPPASPAEGDRHIVAAPGSGAWIGRDGAIAAWQDGAWTFLDPRPGWTVWVIDEALALYWTGAAWAPVAEAITTLQDLALVGIGTAADAVNPFAAKLNKALWTARPAAEGGDGSLRYTMNKEGAANELSVLMQSGYSARAEIGLLGKEDLEIRVSSDGTAWNEALSIERGTGAVAFPSGLRHAATGARIQSLVLASGGSGNPVWRSDAPRAKNPRTASVASVAGDTVTLTTPDAPLFFHDAQMAGMAYVRIWNVSKSAPGASAWVKASPADNQLRVVDAATLAGWVTGETVQIGDPTPDVVATRALAIDISPMLQATFGAVFPQGAVLARTTCQGNGIDVGLALSGTAEAGSFTVTKSNSDGKQNGGMIVVPTPTPSPISQSNLIFLREDASGASDLVLTLLHVLGVFV